MSFISDQDAFILTADFSQNNTEFYSLQSSIEQLFKNQ